MSRVTHLLLVVALLFIVLAGLGAAAPLLSAFLVALVVTQVVWPVVGGLQRRGWPPGAAFVSVLLLTLLLGAGLVFFVGVSLAQVASQLPAYSEQLQAAAQELPSGGVTAETRSRIVDAVIGTIPALLAAVGEAAGMAVLAFLIFAFMLWDAFALPSRLRSAGPMANTVLSSARVYNAEVRRFLIITGTLGALQGSLMAVFLWVVGVDFALLWGLLFTVLVFVPVVGMIIAAVPPIVMAYLEFGLTGAVIVTVGTVVITNVVGQLLKPIYLGRGLNVSRLWSSSR